MGEPRSLLEAQRALLVLVDYQSRLMPAIHEGAAVASNAVRLAQLARALQIPVIGTEQSPDKLGPLVPEVRELCDTVVAKTWFDACADGLLAPIERAAAEGRSQLVVAGCEAHVCLLQTTLGLLQAGFTPWVVSDACGSRTAANRDAAFERLHAAGATFVTTEMVGFEWVRHAGHPAFKTLQALVR